MIALLLLLFAAPLDLRGYTEAAIEASPELAAARAVVDSAKAQLPIAKESPDPQLTLQLTQLELTHRGNPSVAGAQIAWPIELGGKRSARVAAAEAGLRAAELDLDDAVRAVRAAAHSAFVEALHARQVHAQKERALSHLERLVSVNERRLAAGEIAPAALQQSRVEARQFEGEAVAARGEERAAFIELARLLGGFAAVEIAGELRAAPLQMDVVQLLAALENRSDVRAAAARVEAAQRQLKVEEAKRIVDVTVSAGWQHNFPAEGVGRADFLVASLTVPLPFSRIYHGEVEAARAVKRQALSLLRGVRLRAEGELRQALPRYEAAARRAAIFESGTLADADGVLEKTLYNYQRGGATLVEVLVAQRAASDVHLAGLDALADRARALVRLEQASGLTNLLARGELW